MAKQPHYPAAWCTDIGIQKDTNQDSALLLQAETGRESFRLE